jgi:Fic family protein
MSIIEVKYVVGVEFMFREIEEKKNAMYREMPLPPEKMKGIRESLLLDWICNSNAIDGNTLTVNEIKEVLAGVMVGGRTLVEHIEANNHSEAISYVEELVSDGESLSEWKIKMIHKLLMKDIDNENAGEYRKENIIPSRAYYIPPEARIVPDKMDGLIKWHRSEAQKLHPIESAAQLHNDFLKIHPFGSSDGKIARILMNFELMKNGYPPISILQEKKTQYNDAIDDANMAGQHTKMINLINQELNRSMDLFIN